MSRGRAGARTRGIRTSIAAVAAGAALAAGALTAPIAQAATPTPAPTTVPPVGRALAVDLVGTPVLTLPAKDGLRDTTRVRVRSGASGPVDLLATRGRKAVHLADGVRLMRAGSTWQRTVPVSVRDLPAGSWVVRARRSDATSVAAHASARLQVGTGKPVHVRVRPAAAVLYPWKDGVLDRADVAVTGTDETGSPIPLRGSVRLDAARSHRTRALAKGAARIPVTGLPLGGAALTATVTGPAGKSVVRRSALTLAPTGVGAIRLGRSSDTLQPVADGFLDTGTFTTSGAAVAGSPAPVSGTLVLALGTKVLQRWAVRSGAPQPFTWNGRQGAVIVPGTYTLTLTLRGPEGPARSTSRSVLVTKDHLPYTVRDLFSVGDGNQQGLAVHEGTFYVGYDNGDGTSRIDAYDGTGRKLATLGPIDIGHAAELVYSTTTGLLYAANGGAANPTRLWALKPEWDYDTLTDPATAIVGTVDLTALGNNGMVAVDDANGRLLVFSGSAPDYRITPLPLADGQDAAGNPVPRYTPGASVPISITGVPQGLEVVGTQLWVYTSLKGRNHLAKYDLPGSYARLDPAAGTSQDLMWTGEGEGSAVGEWQGAPAFFVGAHAVNRVGMLVPVADE